MKRVLLSCMTLLFMAASAIAQDRAISGKVTDENGEPLPGVSVQVKGTSVGTSTDLEGDYELSVPQDANTLTFTFLGYETLEEAINGRTSVNVTMAPSAELLAEVVVTAQGIERDVRSLGYSVQQVDGEALTQKSEPNVLNTLQGKLAGVNIGSSSGTPGASTNINIRGVTSFTGNNQPLIVIDGIIFSNDVDNTQNTLFGSQPSSRLSDIPPESIESINVLKGPAASVLYGSRAAAGVIVITTKTGEGMAGQTEVTFNSSMNWSGVSGLPSFQNDYGQGTQNQYVPNSTNSWGPAFGTPGTETVQTTWGEEVPYRAYPDNVRDFYQTGTIVQNSLNIASGDRERNYAVALSSTLQDGVIRESGFDRHSVQVGGNYRLDNGVKVGGTITYIKTAQNSPTMGNGGSAFGQITRIPRSFDLMGMDYEDELGSSIYYSTTQNHPLWSLENEFLNSDVDRAFGNIQVGYDFTDWLNVSYRITADTYTDRRKQVHRIGSNRNPTGQVFDATVFRSELNGDLMINAHRQNIFTDGLSGTLLLGQNINQRSFQDARVVADELAIPTGFDNVSSGSIFTNSEETSERRRLLGYYAQLSLDYNAYLFLELSGRIDRSSTLPSDNNTYFYPSVAASFVPSDAFDFSSDVLSYLKIRGNIARVGLDANPYLLNSVFVSATQGNNLANINFPISVGGASIPGFGRSTRIGNPDLKPEFTDSYEVGINIGLLRNRLGLDFTYFYTNSENQIINLAVSNSTGYDTRTTNVGKMTNRGIEAQLSATAVQSRHFSWDIQANYTLIRNKVEEIDGVVQSANIPGNSFIGIAPSIAVGHPYGVIIGTKTTTNENGEYLINPNTGLFMPGTPNEVIANTQPDWTAGITNTFRYKGFTLSALVDFRHGGQIYSFSQTDLRNTGGWAPTGEDRSQPRILPGVIDNGDGTYRPNNIQISAQNYWQGLGGLASEAAVFDATAYRLREVSLMYDLPANALNNTPFGQVSLGLSARNLILWARGFPGDPEVNTQGAGNIQGMDLNGAPATRNYGINLRVTF